MMKKDTFVGFIKTIEKYKKVSEQFGKDVSAAYVKAGLETDFSSCTSYELPVNNFIDSLVDLIGNDFADGNYEGKYAIDFINWWIWECEFGKASVYEYKKDGSTIKEPMAQVTFNDGKTYLVKTPGKLYDMILKDKKLNQKK